MDVKNKLSRRQFIKTSSACFVGAIVLPSYVGLKKRVRFGWVTDIHFAEAEVKWGRYFSESKVKLAEAVDLFNEQGVDFVIETGDFKDQTSPPVEENTLKYLEQIEGVLRQFQGPVYHVLGNHDMDSLSKPQFLNGIENTGIPKDKSYYYFDRGGMRFVVLDACYTKKGEDYDHHNYHWTDANIPEEQLIWLRKVLALSQGPAFIFIHQLLDGRGDLYVNNARKVRKVIEESGKVQAVFQGHKHEGGCNVINDVLYFTLKAMVEGSGEINNSYSIVTVESNGEIKIEGYRKADDYEYAKSRTVHS